jgi:hypothetical protein
LLHVTVVPAFTVNGVGLNMESFTVMAERFGTSAADGTPPSNPQNIATLTAVNNNRAFRRLETGLLYSRLVRRSVAEGLHRKPT